ncbi:18307_t:CDS:2 [Funneliformis geosporum]|uniref:8880_t:CDS:1 n=1 Tax=Funneliformis geosporum TaxID=1117311 RepID=A0A9W4SF61_9GLOM|nr:18307_t:CDS:2 [Funneliformis geosporum]CAI2167308.1 8880_t:CDS:2 [Funneliformis geosporum]
MKKRAVQILEKNLGKERKATMGIGLLFLLLSTATISDAIIALIQKKKPETAVTVLIISSVSLSFMGFLWLSKKYLAKKLDSSMMPSEAQCSLACIKITLKADGAAIDLFAKEGTDMIMWARANQESNQEKRCDCCSDNKVCETSHCANEADYNETTL